MQAKEAKILSDQRDWNGNSSSAVTYGNVHLGKDYMHVHVIFVIKLLYYKILTGQCTVLARNWCM